MVQLSPLMGLMSSGPTSEGHVQFDRFCGFPMVKKQGIAANAGVNA
jgi:hypothetical protein